MELPFENDSLELLDACAVALLPLPAAPEAQNTPPMAQSDTVFAAGSLWQRVPGGDAVMKQSGGRSIGANRLTPLTPLPENGAGFSVEALSREVERDARRFDANA